MLTTDCDTARVAVEVERNVARKVTDNARGVVGLACILSAPLYIKTHCSGLLSMSRIPKSARGLDVVCFYIQFTWSGTRVFNGSGCNPVDS